MAFQPTLTAQSTIVTRSPPHGRTNRPASVSPQTKPEDAEGRPRWSLKPYELMDGPKEDRGVEELLESLKVKREKETLSLHYNPL